MQPPEVVYADNMSVFKPVLLETIPSLQHLKEDWLHAGGFRMERTLPKGHPAAA